MLAKHYDGSEDDNNPQDPYKNDIHTSQKQVFLVIYHRHLLWIFGQICCATTANMILSQISQLLLSRNYVCRVVPINCNKSGPAE